MSVSELYIMLYRNYHSTHKPDNPEICMTPTCNQVTIMAPGLFDFTERDCHLQLL